MNVTGLPAKLVIATSAVAVLCLSGCSEVKEAVNKGGDTPCSEFVKQDTDKQRITITKFLKENSSSDNEPAGTAVDATIVAVGLLCSVQANADAPIKDADIGGIFTPK